MSLSTMMWICLGICLVFCAVYFYITSNKERLAIEESAKKICESLKIAYPEARKQIDSILVKESAVDVSVKEGSDAEALSLEYEKYGIRVNGETTMSALANYIMDCFAEMEWKRTINKQETDNTVVMTGVVLKNVTRLGYTDMKR